LSPRPPQPPQLPDVWGAATPMPRRAAIFHAFRSATSHDPSAPVQPCALSRCAQDTSTHRSDRHTARTSRTTPTRLQYVARTRPHHRPDTAGVSDASRARAEARPSASESSALSHPRSYLPSYPQALERTRLPQDRRRAWVGLGQPLLPSRRSPRRLEWLLRPSLRPSRIPVHPPRLAVRRRCSASAASRDSARSPSCGSRHRTGAGSD